MSRGALCRAQNFSGGERGVSAKPGVALVSALRLVNDDVLDWSNKEKLRSAVFNKDTYVITSVFKRSVKARYVLVGYPTNNLCIHHWVFV